MIECLCLRTIGLIAAPWQFDVLKTIIFESLYLGTAGLKAAFGNVMYLKLTYLSSKLCFSGKYLF